MTGTIDAPTTTRIPHWIGGRRVDGGSGRSGPVFNPATGRQTGAVDFATVEEVDAAVQAARAVFPGWRETSLAKRAELFFRIRELLHARREEVAEIMVELRRDLSGHPRVLLARRAAGPAIAPAQWVEED